MEANLWQNVQRVEKKLFLKNLGRWLEGLIKQEREQSLLLVCVSAVAKPSGPHLTNRKFNWLKIEKKLFIFFGI